jgi:hypothetical protein
MLERELIWAMTVIQDAGHATAQTSMAKCSSLMHILSSLESLTSTLASLATPFGGHQVASWANGQVVSRITSNHTAVTIRKGSY